MAACASGRSCPGVKERDISAVKDPVWLITGSSTGFGRRLARQVMERGWKTVVTAWDSARVADLARGETSVNTDDPADEK